MSEPSSAHPRRLAMPEPSSAYRPNFPDWVLLDPVVHVAPLKNATTAATMTSIDTPIEISFEVVDPPGLSRCVINSSELQADVFSDARRVIAADGAFLLIVVCFPERDARETQTDVFVYKAGPGKPTLRLLPRPCPNNLYSKRAGVLSCGDGHCLVVVPERRLDNLGGMMGYDLQVFSTETSSWTTRAARVASDLQGCCSPLLRHEPTKVFSVGGSSLAWVDVYMGVLLCNVLDMDPEMQLIDLPPLMPSNMDHLGGGLIGPSHILPATRDVMCRDGWIRCIEMEFPERKMMNPTDFRWIATISKRRMFSSDKWETFTVESASILPSESCFPGLFPDIWDGKGKLALNKVLCSAPILDAYHEYVVYLKFRLNPRDLNGWIIAIDTREKKLVTLVPFTTRRFYFNQYFLQCDFSKYINKAAENSMDKVSENCTNREKILLLETHLQAALYQLHNIEIHVASLKQEHSMSMSLLCPGQANIQKVSEYGLDQGRGKYVTNPVDKGYQFMRDLDLHISARADAMKKEIRVAHDALCKLMQSLSPYVLDEEIVE